MLVARAIAVVLTLGTYAPCADAAERHTGRVTHVVDGQSVDVLVKTRRLRVRLAGIDAPQGQLAGLRSRQSLIQLCSGEPATVHPIATSGKGFMVGYVACGGTDAGAEQIRRGMARVSENAAADLRQLRALEAEARAAHRGVWATRPP